MRYVHPSDEHERAAVEKLEKFNAGEAIKAVRRSGGPYNFHYSRPAELMRVFGSC